MAADHQHQQQGVVIRFLDNKGYGFIKPDSSDKDLFVHHTECQGYRSLQEGQKVKFSVSVKNGKKVAVNVTASDCCSNCGGAGHLARVCTSTVVVKFVGRCYNCNEEGHLARECSSGTSSGRGCYNCGEEGHFARECRSSTSSGRGCYNCGEEGHFARECRSGTSSGRGCYNCRKEGHFARDCTKGRVDGGRVSRGDGGRAVRRGNNGGAATSI